MGQPFIGEIRMFGGSFAPAGWAFCNGQLIPISENDALFTLIGTTYGGDGQETFALPNLQSRVPMHAGTGPDGVTYQLGEAAGVESVTLSIQQIPVHTHPELASNTPAAARIPGGNVPAQGAGGSQIYTSASSPITIAPTTVSPAGGSQPHENMQPFLVISFIISLFGIFPTQN
jgi:microcystin-dependent protein